MPGGFINTDEVLNVILKKVFSSLCTHISLANSQLKLLQSAFLGTTVPKSKIQTGTFSVLWLLTCTHHVSFSLHVLQKTWASSNIFKHFEACNLAGP